MDKVLACVDCGDRFIFSHGEQEFFKSRGLEHEPKRCVGCRRARRAKRPITAESLENPPGERKVFEITCSECGVKDTVPFEPDGSRAVYCRLCLPKPAGAREEGAGAAT